jgi:hypothetical protein
MFYQQLCRLPHGCQPTDACTCNSLSDRCRLMEATLRFHLLVQHSLLLCCPLWAFGSDNPSLLWLEGHAVIQTTILP